MQIWPFIIALATPTQAPIVPKNFAYKPYWYVTSSIGESFGILGSSDIRVGSSINLGYAKPEPKLRFRRNRGQMVWEVYGSRSYSNNEPTSPDNSAIGGLVLARWHGRPDPIGRNFFVDLGWGLQFANRETIDLDSRLNSTPTLDLGATFPMGRSEFLFMIRYMHASNAGTKGDNRGNNLVSLMAGIRF